MGLSLRGRGFWRSEEKDFWEKGKRERSSGMVLLDVGEEEGVRGKKSA